MSPGCTKHPLGSSVLPSPASHDHKSSRSQPRSERGETGSNRVVISRNGTETLLTEEEKVNLGSGLSICTKESSLFALHCQALIRDELVYSAEEEWDRKGALSRARGMSLAPSQIQQAFSERHPRQGREDELRDSHNELPSFRSYRRNKEGVKQLTIETIYFIPANDDSSCIQSEQDASAVKGRKRKKGSTLPECGSAILVLDCDRERDSEKKYRRDRVTERQCGMARSREVDPAGDIWIQLFSCCITQQPPSTIDKERSGSPTSLPNRKPSPRHPVSRHTFLLSTFPPSVPFTSHVIPPASSVTDQFKKAATALGFAQLVSSHRKTGKVLSSGVGSMNGEEENIAG
ncbi:unnamed protein product [Darwinula stevensoni]|uniref:Uncharacterized protein n=1 Tax=Darwinula stevensoni TaxID=69355 RepID=A0A7R8XB16_9CRUS|nr:unnamed protein product [Darwinula stevensoni]CAG0890568.1 unnamed protein product [Darwinula stevensoni]